MTNTDFSRRQVLKGIGVGAAGAALGLSGLPLGGISTAKAQSATPLKWMGWGGATGQAKIADLVAKQIPAMGAKYAVQTIDGGPGDQDVANQLRLALASGQNIPEIVTFNRTQVAEFAAAGELLTIDDLVGQVKDDLYAGALDLAKYGDNYVAFPFELKSKMFYWRGDLFDKAGVDASKIVSFDDFINAGKTLQAKTGASIINLGPQPADYWPGEIVSSYPDTSFFADAQGNYTLTTNKGYAAAWDFIKKLYDSGVTLKVDDFSTDWQPAIAGDKIGGFLLSNWLKLFLPTFAPAQKGQWKFGLWPQLTPYADQRYGSEAGGSVLVVFKRSANAQAAADYLRQVLFEKAGALVAYQAFGTTPLIKSAKDEFLELSSHPKQLSGMSDADFAAQPGVFFGPDFAATELQTYDYVKVMQYDPAASKGLAVIKPWLQKYIAGQVDLTAALSSAQSDLEAQIGNPYQQ